MGTWETMSDYEREQMRDAGRDEGGRHLGPRPRPDTPEPRFEKRRNWRCGVCGGPARRRTNAAAPSDMEDVTYPLLHVNTDDWRDNPHDVEPVEVPS